MNIERSLEICRSAIEKSTGASASNLVIDTSSGSASALKLQQTLTTLEPLPPTGNHHKQHQQLHQIILPVQPQPQQQQQKQQTTAVLQATQQHLVPTSAANLLPFVTSQSQFVTSQPHFVTSGAGGNTAQAVLVKTADGKTILATAAPGQFMRQIRPISFQNLQPQLQQQQQQQQQQIQMSMSLPTSPLPAIRMATNQQMLVIPTSGTDGEQQQQQQQHQQVFRIPVSSAISGGGAVFLDASKQKHVIPQAVLVSRLCQPLKSTDFFKHLAKMLDKVQQ